MVFDADLDAYFVRKNDKKELFEKDEIEKKDR